MDGLKNKQEELLARSSTGSAKLRVDQTKKTNILYRIILVIMGLVGGIIIGEILIRFLVPPSFNPLKMNGFIESERGKFTSYDPVLGWIGLKNVESDFKCLEVSHHVRQNKYGFRGGEYSLERSGKPRLSVLGDSFVWGYGVEDGQLFTSLLERNANWQIEVVNLGVSGYGTDQEYLLWHNTGHLWKPDQVLLLVHLCTDLWDNTSSRVWGYEKPVFRQDAVGNFILENSPVPRTSGPWNIGLMNNVEDRSLDRKLVRILAIARHSAVVSTFLNLCAKNADIRGWLEANNILRARQGVVWEAQMYSSQPTGQLLKGWQMTLSLISRLDSEVKAKGGRLIVAVAPTPAQVYPTLWNETIGKQSQTYELFDPRTPDRRLQTWCRHNGIQFIDLLTPLKKAGESNPYLYFPFNLHWTRDGHSIVADVLGRELSISHK